MKNKSGMQWIYMISLLFLVLEAAKYLFVVNISPVFIGIDISGLLIVLGLLYYQSSRLMPIKDCKDEECQAEIRSLQDRIVSLQAMLESNQVSDAKKNDSLAVQNKFVTKMCDIKNKLSKQEQLIPALFKEINDHFEPVCAVVYAQNESNAFGVVHTFGIDEDIQIAPAVLGEGLNGQALSDMTPIEIEDVPCNYFTVSSGIGESKAAYIYLLPYQLNDKTVLFEVGTFKKVSLLSAWTEFMKA